MIEGIMTKEEMFLAILNLYLYAESAVQFITVHEMEKKIAEIYDVKTLIKVTQFIEKEISEEDLEELMKQESIKQYMLNLEKVVKHVNIMHIVDSMNEVDNNLTISTISESKAEGDNA